MPEPIIEVHGLSKDFLLPHLRVTTIKSRALNLFRRTRTVEHQHALREIDFDVARGEFLGVVGRNGSGKSTLLKLMAGIYAPSSGEVITRGKLVPFIELGVGFHPELTGRENVYLNGALLGFSKGEVSAMYDDIVAFAELEGFMDQKLKNYSTGMQVRIAFSMATRARGDIILVDEVLAVGDAAFQEKCFDHFRALKKRGTTIVFVSHDMAAVREFCDRAILIEDTRLVADGSADDIAGRYAQLFLKVPAKPSADSAAKGGTPAGPVFVERRTGTGEARYTAVTAPYRLSGAETLTLDLTVKAERDISDPMYTVVIKDANGTRVLGSDSATQAPPGDRLTAGQEVELTWSVPNALSDGVYTVELSITDRRRLVVHDWWLDAAEFRVERGQKTPYVVAAPATFRIGAPHD